MTKALLLMDYLNDIVHPNGALVGHGYAEQVESRHVLRNADQAAQSARRANILVIHVRVAFGKNYKYMPANSPIFSNEFREVGALQEEAWGSQTAGTLSVGPGEITICKRRVSPFYGTDLELLLRTEEIDELVIGGVATNLVVLACARDAHDRDFRVTVLEDACAARTSETHRDAISMLSDTASISSVEKAFTNSNYSFRGLEAGR